MFVSSGSATNPAGVITLTNGGTTYAQINTGVFNGTTSSLGATQQAIYTVPAGYTFYGLVGPAKLPNDIVVKINAAINKVAAIPEVAERMREVFSAEPTVSTPVSYRQFVEKELAKWQEISKSLKTETGN
jgi:hypothetical protein